MLNNKGYEGYSMSVRAGLAYDQGKKPISKWSKNDIIDAVLECAKENEIVIDYNFEDLNKLNKKELCAFLYCSEWHHTSNHYNKTDFYKVDEDVVEDYSKEKINDVISKRAPKAESALSETQNLYITSLVQFDYWTGTRSHPKKEIIVETVYYRTNDKMVKTSCGNKRLSSLKVIKTKSQKTKFAKEVK